MPSSQSHRIHTIQNVSLKIIFPHSDSIQKLDLFGSRLGPVAGSCKSDEETSDSIKFRHFFTIWANSSLRKILLRVVVTRATNTRVFSSRDAFLSAILE